MLFGPWFGLLAFGSAFLVTVIVTPLVIRASIGAGRVTPVRQDRWHDAPTPSLGGVGIFLGFGLVVWLASILLGQVDFAPSAGRPGILPISTFEALMAASCLAFLVGLTDDFLELNPISKLVGQLVAASILLMSGIGLWLTGIYVLDALLSLIWFIGITNALNLLDNMDGLAGGVAVIAVGFLSAIFFLDGNLLLAGMALTLAGSILGFLCYNYPPAKIFMGDSGSLFLGMLLSGLALSPGPGLSRSLLAVMAVPALVLAVPILDTTLVTVSRVLEGRSVSEGGRDHSSHRLVSLGISEERAVWILWTLALFGGSVGLLFRTADRRFAALGGGLAAVALALVGGYLLQARFKKLREEGIDATGLYETLLKLNDRFPLALFALDGFLVALAYYGAYLIRWDAPQLAEELQYFQRSLPVVLVVKLVAFRSLRIYTGDLRHQGLGEGVSVLRANLVATVSVVAALLMLQRTGLSRGVIAIDLLLASILTLASRFSFRVMESWARSWSKEGTPAVLLGRVEDMDVVVTEMEKGRWPELRPVAIADPNVHRKQGSFHGYLLFGGMGGLQRAMKKTKAGAVVRVQADGGGPYPHEVDPPDLGVDQDVQVFTLRVGMTLTPHQG